MKIIPVLLYGWVQIVSFPYVSQRGPENPMINDCGSAAVRMVTEFYDVAGEETVTEIHQDMARGDFPTTYILVADYIEETYGLQTDVITNYPGIKYALQNAGFDVSMIEVVETIPDDVPIIWVYATEPHWVVRYGGWNFDPNNGVFRFSKTEIKRGIDRPYLGLGIVITNP